MRTLLRALLLGVLAMAMVAGAEPGWQTLTEKPFRIRVRPLPANPKVQEVWSEADLRAGVVDIQAALTDPNAYARFMPYVKECRELLPPDADGSRYTYTRLALPVVQGRDYVLHVFVDMRVAADGSGSFKQHWTSVPDRIPARKGITRVSVNQGSWTVTPNADGSSHAIYQFAVDPGGSVPSIFTDLGNRGATEDTLRAVEREAQARAKARQLRSAGAK